jgi:NAD(P)-dependent dehydrogenase (short-subunit alcohol dehydrogenase family)
VVANGTRPSTIGLLKTVADEYAQFGVTVKTVAPGRIETQNAIAYLDRQAGVRAEIVSAILPATGSGGLEPVSWSCSFRSASTMTGNAVGWPTSIRLRQASISPSGVPW